MARQVLPIVGAAIDIYFGGNGQIGYAIGAAVGNAVDPLKVAGPKLGEGSAQTSAEGVYRPIVLGTAPVGGNIIHRGPEIIRTQKETQGKGGGPVTITERRYRTFAIRIAEGPIAAILRVWMDEKLVYDIRPESPIPEDSIQFEQRFRLYLGTEDQLPDPALEAYLGIGNVNSYHGTAYIVFENFDLTDYGDRIPQFRFEVTSNGGTIESEMLILGTRSASGGGDRFILPSPDGIDWSGAYNYSGTSIEPANAMIAAGNRIIIWAPTVVADTPFYSSDSGVTFTPSLTQLGTAGPDFRAAYVDGVIIIPGRGDGFWRSDNLGETFTRTPSPFSNAVAGFQGLQLSISAGEPIVRISEDTFVTSHAGGAHGLSLGSSYDICSCVNYFLIGGSDSGEPAITKTLDGETFSLETMPSFNRGGSISCITFANGIAIAGTNHGEIAFKPDGLPWQLSPTTLGGSDIFAADCAWSGERFVMVGYSSFGPGSPGVIAYSETGEDWTIADTAENISPRAVVNMLGRTVGVGNPVPLNDVVDFLHERVDVTSEWRNTSELTELVDGIVFADGYMAADAIRTLMPVYMFDSVECDSGFGYKLNYIKRGKPVVTTLTIDDLVDANEESVREDSLERPKVLHLHFQNPTIGYAPAKASPRRNSQDVKVVGEVTTSVPVVFSNVDEAWQRADIILKVTWAEVGGSQDLTLAYDWFELAPTDCIGLLLRGSVRRLRMVKQEIVAGTLKTEWRADRQSAYTSTLTGIPLPEPEPPPSSIAGPTFSIFGDWPALSDNHDTLVSYAAACGLTEAWWGAAYQRSLNSGATYTTVATFNSSNSIMGVLIDDLSSASPYYTDNTNVVRISLYMDDELESITDQEFLSEGGAFALSWQDSGQKQWEIMQYRDAEQDTNGDWILTVLHRGRLNTEAAQHSAGDIFVFLDNNVKVMPMQSSMLDMELTHRAVSNGQSPESAVPYQDEYEGISQTEWEVANLFGDISGSMLNLSCVPRHRFGTDDNPVQSVNHTGYRWSATDGANTQTYDTASPLHSFDVSGWSTPITVSVAQINRLTGPGPAVTEVIE